MTIKRTLYLLLLTSLLSSCMKSSPVLFSKLEGNFNEGWEFVKDPADSISPELFKKSDLQQSTWQKVTLPHTANIEAVDSQEKQWQGTARYRKFFTVPKQFDQKSVSLQFGAAMQVAKIYLNGELVQTHTGGYLPFEVKLDGKVKFGGQNCIVVELDNRDNPLVPPGKPLAKLDFNYYSGLYRNVTIVIKDKLHISNSITANRVAGGGLLVTYNDVTEQSAKINVQVDVENESKDSKPASLQISLLDAIGIRTFSFTATDGFVLNGQKLKLRGTNRHQEYPYIGYAVPDNAQYRDDWKLKQAGFNFVRSSHYPQSPAFLAACDELGILVMDAIPGWQFVGNEEFQNHSIRDTRE